MKVLSLFLIAITLCSLTIAVSLQPKKGMQVLASMGPGTGSLTLVRLSEPDSLRAFRRNMPKDSTRQNQSGRHPSMSRGNGGERDGNKGHGHGNDDKNKTTGCKRGDIPCMAQWYQKHGFNFNGTTLDKHTNCSYLNWTCMKNRTVQRCLRHSAGGMNMSSGSKVDISDCAARTLAEFQPCNEHDTICWSSFKKFMEADKRNGGNHDNKDHGDRKDRRGGERNGPGRRGERDHEHRREHRNASRRARDTGRRMKESVFGRGNRTSSGSRNHDKPCDSNKGDNKPKKEQRGNDEVCGVIDTNMGQCGDQMAFDSYICYSTKSKDLDDNKNPVCGAMSSGSDCEMRFGMNYVCKGKPTSYMKQKMKRAKKAIRGEGKPQGEGERRSRGEGEGRGRGDVNRSTRNRLYKQPSSKNFLFKR